VPHAPKMLGKKPAKRDPRTLQLASYVGRTLPPAPDAVDWAKDLTAFPMYANDVIGSCAIATPAHMVRAMSASDGKLREPSEADVVAGYQLVGGYRPGDPSTDNGCIMLDVLNHWRKVGFFGGDRIAGYAKVNTHDGKLTRQAVNLFGGLALGVSLPLAVQDLDVWELPTRREGRREREQWFAGSWGGHAVPVIAYDGWGLDFISWGKRMRMTWDFYLTYCDEAFVVLSKNWLGDDSQAPNGFDALQLAKDLRGLS
jgi:hypothetical protein